MLRKVLIAACMVSVTAFAYAGKKKKKETEKTTQSASDTINYKLLGAPLPNIRLVKDNGTILNSRQINNEGNLFVMMYNPTCEHCQEQAVTFIKHLDLFNKSRLIMMAAPGMASYQSFFETVTKVSKYPKIDVGLDSSDFINKTFIYESLPQINIYDKDRKLTRIFTGDTPIDTLKPYIQ